MTRFRGTSPRGAPPRGAAALLERLLPGPIGSDARDDLAREHARIAERHGRLVAGAWYALHLLRPGTWLLARAVRRGAARGVRPVPGSPVGGGGRGGRGGGGRGGGGWRLGISWIDVKLGLRMLVKHPGLTAVSGLAMSVTIAIAIATFSVFQDFLLRPTVPLPEGERIVSLGMLATERGLTYRQLLHDFEIWRDGLETVQDLSIWRSASANLVGEDGMGAPAGFTMMSARGFEVARVPPLLGRPLLESDQRPGAPSVMVISYDEWTRRYDGDPDVLGRTVQVGREPYTIVGVMPEGYGFPLAAIRWVPFRDDPDDFALLETPHSYFVFGRLAPGVTMDAAQAELSAIASRRAAELPESHGKLRAIVMTYTDTHTGMDNAGGLFIVRLTLGVLTLLVLIPFVNVAILLYARTATRAGELSIRSALGASRRRVVGQLFVEALVLAAVSAVAGVALVFYAMSLVDTILTQVGDGGGMPFWAKQGRDPWVAAYVVGLTLLAAVVAGVIPGLKATGRGVQARLAQAAGGNGIRLGGAWTGLIVAQVAVTVAFLPFVASLGWQMIGIGMTRPTFDAEQVVAGYIGAPLSVGSLEARTYADPTGEREAARERARQSIEEVVRRLEGDERVADVTFSTDRPGSPGGASFLLEVEGVAPPVDRPSHRVGGRMAVAEDYFDILGVAPMQGRAFHATDLRAESPPVVVNRAFVEQILGGANALGRSVRYHRGAEEDPGPWMEIVGVVDNLVTNPTHPDRVEPRMYTPFDRGDVAEGVFLVVRVPGDAQAFVPELRRITTAVDPTLRLGTVTALGELDGTLASMVGAASAGFAVVVLAALLLCTASVFSLMSVNVTQRRREIGVRSALGANPGRVLASIMIRSVKQLSAGVALGLVVVVSIPPIDADGIMIEPDAGPIALVAVVMAVVGLLAAVGPARRGLRIHPSEALRAGS